MTEQELRNPRGDSIALAFDRGTLLVRGLGSRELSALLAKVLTWDPRVGALRCDALDYAAVREASREAFGSRVRDAVPPPARVAWPKADLLELRPEQRHA